MKVIDPGAARRGGSSAHRPGGISFTYLLEGEEFALDNHGLMLVHVADHYTAPRHRHNFEQIRVMLEGSFGFGPGREQGPGSIGYFTEGTYYTQDGRGPSTTLLLQVAGASGQSYMSERQMRSGVEAVGSRGSFEGGILTWHDDAGKKHNQDGYEAAWEHVFGRPMTYPAPRYDGPVLIDPARFEWVADASCPGLAEKFLGAFNERGLAVSGWRLDAGCTAGLGGDGRRSLGYVMRGSAAAASGVALSAGFAFELGAGEAMALVAGGDGVEILRFLLPRF